MSFKRGEEDEENVPFFCRAYFTAKLFRFDRIYSAMRKNFFYELKKSAELKSQKETF